MFDNALKCNLVLYYYYRESHYLKYCFFRFKLLCLIRMAFHFWKAKKQMRKTLNIYDVFRLKRLKNNCYNETVGNWTHSHNALWLWHVINIVASQRQRSHYNTHKIMVILNIAINNKTVSKLGVRIRFSHR